MAASALETQRLCKSFGALTVAENIDFRLAPGARHALIGPVVYIVVQDTLAKQYPEYWFLGIGILLIFVVLFARGGVLGILDHVFARNKKAL